MAQTMDAKDLARWTRFANKGGIGKCTAIQDCVAQGIDDLMFLADDEITVLMQLQEENVFLGYCEGVVGRFNGTDVRFHGKLKKPVIQKRSSTSTASLKSVSPIHSPMLPRDEDMADLGSGDPNQSGRLSLPPLPKSNRTTSITEDIQEKFNSNRPKSAVSSRSNSRPSSSRPASPKTASSSTTTTKRKGGLNTESVSSSPVPSSSDDHAIYSLNFPKPPTHSVPNPTVSRSTSIRKKVESVADSVADSMASNAASASTRRPTSSVSRGDMTRDSAFSTTLNESVLSVALEDDIETGIGLRLLAGLSGSESEDYSDEEERTAMVFQQVFNKPLQTQTQTAVPAHQVSSQPQAPSASHQQQSHSLPIPSPHSQQLPLPTPPLQSSHMFESPPISPRSAYDESMDSEWDGGADIYDNYRYSRYSTSAKSSRTSTPRGGPLGGSYFSERTPRERKESNTSSNAARSERDRFDRFDNKRRSTATTVSSIYSEHDSFSRPPVRRNDSHDSSRLSVNEKDRERDRDRDTLMFPLPPATEPLKLVKKSPRPSPLNLDVKEQTSHGSPISNTLKSPPLLSPTAPLTPSSNKHASSGTNQSRSPLLHTAFASPTTSVYSQTSVSQTNTPLEPFSEDDDSDIRSTIASDITERNVFDSVESVLEKAQESRGSIRDSVISGISGPSALPSGIRERVVAGRKDSSDTVIESVDEHAHQDEEVIVFNGSNLSRRSNNGLSTVTPETTMVTESSMSISAMTDVSGITGRTTSPTSMSADASNSSLEPPPSLAIDHTSTPSPTPAFPPSPSAFTSPTPPIDSNSLPQSSGPSLFPPHPFAPKAPTDTNRHTRGPSIHKLAGVGVGVPQRTTSPYSAQQQFGQSQQRPVVSPSLAQTLRDLAMTYSNQAPVPSNQLRRAATIHGRTEKDLASASGPVPIVWSVDGWRERDVDKQKVEQPKKSASKGETRMTIMMPQLVKRGSKASLRIPQQQQQQLKVPIPRANFNPSAGGPRPRSRSFSDFAEIIQRPPRVGSPSSPLASPKFPPARTGSPLAPPGVNPTLRAPNMVALDLDLATRAPIDRKPSPSIVQAPRMVSNPPPRTESSRLGLGLGVPSEDNRIENRSPQTPLTAVPRNMTTPPVKPPSPVRNPTPPTFIEQGQSSNARFLTRSPSPLGSNTMPSIKPEIPQSQSASPRIGSIRAQPNPRSQSSADSHHRLDAQAAPPTSHSEPLVPPMRGTTSPSSEPAGRSTTSSPGVPQSVSPPAPASVNMRTSLRKVQSSASLRSSSSRTSFSKPNFDHPFPFDDVKSPVIPSQPPTQPPSRRSSRLRSFSRLSHDRASHERRPSVDTTRSTDYAESVYTHHTQQMSGSRENDNATSPPISPVRTASLLSRKSFSQLRTKGIKAVREVTSPTQVEFEEETIQVKDMEFELVKPIIRHRGDHRDSEESAGDSKEALSPRAEFRPDVDSLRSFSPNVSVPRTPDAQSPAASSVNSFSLLQAARQPPAANGPSPLGDVNHEAHRARELKWISSMSSIPSTQARKNKKIRKLLQEPVPDSVRYLVWAHVLDAKAKRIQGVYSQIGNRPRGPISAEIEKDAQRCFIQQPHLRDPKGPLISVVNAYLAMVPDIRYHPGLTIIAGHLLLQSPEEDAFWILLALMETHLRPYYSLSGSQLEADAYLFTKVLESIDSQLAHVLFVDLRVRPIDLCRGWFPSIFSGVLPNTHIHRVWDLLFYEGPILLFRVGVSLLQLIRRQIIQHLQSPHPILPMLISPDPELLPHVEVFLNHVLSLKLNDSDLRKQRTKIEASMRPPQRSTTTSRLRK